MTVNKKAEVIPFGEYKGQGAVKSGGATRKEEE